MVLVVAGLRPVVGFVLGPVVAGVFLAPVVAGVVRVDRVPRVLRGAVVLDGLVVALDGLFAGLFAGLLAGRSVLPPPMVPPPAAGSCCAIVMLAVASTHTNAVMAIRGRRHRVDIRFSPAT